MAATQAGSQQNEVKREQVQNDQPPDLSNSVLQNGTEKNGGRGISGTDSLVSTKTKASGQNSLAVEMSQYRQDSGTGPPIHNSSGNGEQNSGVSSVDNNKVNPDSKSFASSAEQCVISDPTYGKGSDNNSQNLQSFGLGFSARGNYHPDQHGATNTVQNSGDTSSLQQNPFSQFNTQIRHSYHGSKIMQTGVMHPSRPASVGPIMTGHSGSYQQQQQQQQRYQSGQGISQPTGPTPTLNQLLQSSNPVHRYQNSFSDYRMSKANEHGAVNVPYNQPGAAASWSPSRPAASYSPHPQQPATPIPPVITTRGSDSYLSGPAGLSCPPFAAAKYNSDASAAYADAQMYSSQVRDSLGQLHVAHYADELGALEERRTRTPQPPGPGPGTIAAPGAAPGPTAAWRKARPPQPPQPPPPQPPSQQPPQAPPTQQRSPQPQTAPSPGQASCPYRPQQPSTPNAHAPDAADLTGQNSNDSSSGPAPGTPNSQGMRPTPSPTGSTGSRSMSPAVGQQNIPMPPRPSSGQSDGSGPTRMSHSPMATQGNYQQPLAPPSHLHGYKLPGQQMGPYTPQGQQYPQGSFNQRPPGQMGSVQYTQSYGPGSQQNPQANSMNPGQYSSRAVPNHVPHPQFGGYQGWGGPGLNQPPNMMGGPGSQMVAKSGGPQSGVPTQAANTASGPRPHTPPHYLKQHLQHKMGFSSSVPGMPPSPAGLQGYGGASAAGLGPGPGSGPASHHHSVTSMGPPTHHPGMGPPPPSMGPPPGMAPPSASGGPAPPPPPAPSVATGAPSPLPNSHHDAPMPPPAPSANSHPAAVDVAEPAHDNGLPVSTASITGTTTVNVTAAASGSVTSVVTTGPDGTPLDEGSQQSTLSNASAASGEDPSCTPKSRKDGSVVGNSGGYHSHPPTPQSTVASPGAASLNSMHEEYGDVNSPSWPRTPASPKPDSLCKLYEMDENHERRMWLDKLLQFMEERGTPISACPTISKNPLDLYRLYAYVKERGGFMEVTKNKTWKDIAGLLGIGASSSAAYTLRKHYTKNLLAFECHFDRGGIDPQPIINQVESTSKKKTTKTSSVPSPGSSNSQDSFPAAGSSGASMDGYSYGYPPGSTPDYSSPPMQRPSSQTNAPSPHPGVGVPTQGAGDNISVSNPFDDVATGQRPNPYCPSGGPSRPQGIQQGYQGQSGYTQYQDQYPHSRGQPTNMGQEFSQQYSPSSSYPPARPMYPPYASEAERGYGQGGGTQQSAGSQDPFGHNRYVGPSQPPGYPSRTGYPAPPTGPPAQQPTGYPPQQDYYRQDPVYPGQQAATATGPGAQMYPGSPHSKSMPPPAPQTPRRHPDFTKEQQQPPYPPYSQQRPSIYGWSSGNNQYRGQYPPQGPVPQGPPQWNQNAQRAGGPVPGQPANSQWDQHRYPASGQSPYQPPQQTQQQWVPSMQTPGINQNSLLRPPIVSPRAPFRPEGKPYSMQQLPGSKAQPPGMNNAQVYQQQTAPKREIVFPPESVEATLPVLYKRKRMTRGDVAPVEAWRLMMSLRSGLLAESAWALDILNILLFDDTTVAYFGLAHMPGLLDVLLEHFRRSLADMFDSPLPDSGKKWFQAPKSDTPEVDLGQVKVPVDPADHITLMKSTPNYTLVTRKGEVVRIVNKDNEIFVTDDRKSWDIEGDMAENDDVVQDPWQLTSSDISSTKYIVSCFQGEFGNVPFARLLDDGKTVGAEEDEDCRTKVSAEGSYPVENLSVTPPIVLKVECSDDNGDDNGVIDSSSSASNVILNEEHLSKDSPFVDAQDSDAVKRTKTILSDVFSRIKKENTEENSLLSQHCVDPLELPKETVEVKKEENCVESESSSNNEKELLHSPSVPKDIDTKSDNAVAETNDTNNFSSSNIKTEHTNNDNSSNSNESSIFNISKGGNCNSTTPNESSCDYKIKEGVESEIIASEENSEGNESTGNVVEGTSLNNCECLESNESSNGNNSCDETVKEHEETETEMEQDVFLEGSENEGKDIKMEDDYGDEIEEKPKATDVRPEIKGENRGGIQIRDPAGTLKRRRMSDYEDECYARDEASLYLVTDTQDAKARRCVCLSNILRNLTFVPGNEAEFAKNVTFLGLLGKLLLLHHEHPPRAQKQRNYDREEDADFADSCSSLQGEAEWWWDFLHHVRENVLVTAANIAGHMDLGQHPEEVSRPVIDGLLHWAVCPAAHGQDPFPGSSGSLSPQRLALEALCKLCVTDSNVDLVVATPPYSRLERLCAVLTRLLCRSEEQVLREFAVNMLHYLAAADSGVARTVALQSPCVSLLVAFIEQAEATALGVANQHGIGALRDNPDAMGTSLDMLRRAAGTLLHLARHPENRPLFLQQEQRLLSLVMSQILDQQVAAVISSVLFQCSRPSS